MIPYFRVIRQYERGGVFWLGRFVGLRGAGLHIFFWPFHTVRIIDLREDVIDIPRQTNITADNAPIDIDFLVYMRVIEHEAEKSVLEVVDYRSAVIGIATTTLRAVIGNLTLDEVLSQRERINEELRSRLDEVTERWGIKVTQVEIREIEPPRDIQDAMNKQMSAERFRRAVVTEAQGKREADITVAEGEKQAAILKAEGDRQAEILKAEGDRQAAILRAEGFSQALDKIYQVARTVDANTMGLQYLDALKQIGTAPSTKFIFPMELTGLLEVFANRSRGDDTGR